MASQPKGNPNPKNKGGVKEIEKGGGNTLEQRER